MYVIDEIMDEEAVHDYEGGANIPSLRKAQKNYVLFGACEERCIEFVREPVESDVKDLNWKPL